MPVGIEKLDIDWEELIYRGVESDELDYKYAMDWIKLSRAGKAKLVRHCLAFANTKGGYIVIGVGEESSGHPSKYIGLTDKESHSFDPSIVGPFIHRYVEPPIDFTIERPVVDGKRYAVFVVRPFSTLPHVCTMAVEGELQAGVFYIRTVDASSRPAVRAIEMHGLIQRALRNQRELLGRMLRGILYENRNVVADDGSLYEDEENTARVYFERRNSLAKNQIRLTLSVVPSNYNAERFSFDELREVIEDVWPMMPSGIFASSADMVDAYSTNTALRIYPDKSQKMSQLGKSGLLFFICNITLDDNFIEYDDLVRFFTDAINCISNIYAYFDFAEELLTINVTLSKMEKVALRLKDSQNEDFICRINEIKTSISRSAADLCSGREAHTARLIRDVCDRFNLPEKWHRNLLSMIDNNLKRL